MTSVAIIGTGYWGKNLVRNFHALGVLRAIHDTNTSTAEALGRQFGVETQTWQAILANPDISAVAIATPAISHAPLIKAALLAGKHVFVEKPLALNVADAEEVVNLAKSLSRTLMVGHLMQYHSGFLALKDLIQSGKLGRLQYLYSNRLNLGKIRREEDTLWSFAPHDISMILGLVGHSPTEVTATGGYYLHQNIADVTTTHLKFAGGEQAHIFVSWLHPFKEQKLVVVGNEAMAVLDDCEPLERKLTLYPHQINWKNGEPFPQKENGQAIDLANTEPLLSECQHFIDCIQSSKTSRTDGDEGLRVLKVLTQASAALERNKYVRIIESKKPEFFVHETAIVDLPSKIGTGTKIWHFSHVLAGSNIGPDCIIGQNVTIGPNVNVGAHCKIQNNVSLYSGVTLEDGVFCGPSCVFTNVLTPRAEINRRDEFLLTHVGRAATIGANATIVCGVTLGAYCLIGAGAVVTKNVPAHALMVGNPAKQIGWVSHSGERLQDDLTCPREGRRYIVTHDNQLQEVLTEGIGISA